MTPMLLWIAAALAVGLGVGMVVGMRIRSNRVLDAQMARELARPPQVSRRPDGEVLTPPRADPRVWPEPTMVTRAHRNRARRRTT